MTPDEIDSSSYTGDDQLAEVIAERDALKAQLKNTDIGRTLNYDMFCRMRDERDALQRELAQAREESEHWHAHYDAMVVLERQAGAALAEVRGELEQCRAQVRALVKTLARAEGLGEQG
jgi:SMC interacting uncharacterized protein involved in chromosome segregation